MKTNLKDLSPETMAKYFDHTLLRADAVDADFIDLCQESLTYGFKMVAINPAPVALCHRLLKDSGVHVGAAVGFPLGQNTEKIKLLETQDAIENGCDEIDYVININRLKERDYTYIEKEMADIVTLCREHSITSKVIFENCYLTEQEQTEMCRIALNIKPDYIKTSTGFGCGGATLADVKRMIELVHGEIKVKAAGGIRDLQMVLALLDMGVQRIGSTSGITIIEELKKQM